MIKMVDKLCGKYIGYPCTPSQWIAEPEYKKISVITMTCGGGMGGSKWYEYVERIPPHNKLNEIQTFTTIEGKEIRLNPQYMVKIEDFTMVTVWYETTNQLFCREGNRKSLLNKKFLIEDGQTVELIDDFADKAKRMNRR